MVLVDELASRGEWDSLCEYGELLFERTHTVRDAERLAHALTRAQNTEQLAQLLVTNPDLVAQSTNLRMLYCWSLFDAGALLEARTELAKLSDDCENPNYRSLHVGLAIALGDWNSLSGVVTNEYLRREERSAQFALSCGGRKGHYYDI